MPIISSVFTRILTRLPILSSLILAAPTITSTEGIVPESDDSSLSTKPKEKETPSRHDLLSTASNELHKMDEVLKIFTDHPELRTTFLSELSALFNGKELSELQRNPEFQAGVNIIMHHLLGVLSEAATEEKQREQLLKLKENLPPIRPDLFPSNINGDTLLDAVSRSLFLCIAPLFTTPPTAPFIVGAAKMGKPIRNPDGSLGRLSPQEFWKIAKADLDILFGKSAIDPKDPKKERHYGPLFNFTKQRSIIGFGAPVARHIINSIFPPSSQDISSSEQIIRTIATAAMMSFCETALTFSTEKKGLKEVFGSAPGAGSNVPMTVLFWMRNTFAAISTAAIMAELGMSKNKAQDPYQAALRGLFTGMLGGSLSTPFYRFGLGFYDSERFSLESIRRAWQTTLLQDIDHLKETFRSTLKSTSSLRSSLWKSVAESSLLSTALCRGVANGALAAGFGVFNYLYEQMDSEGKGGSKRNGGWPLLQQTSSQQQQSTEPTTSEQSKNPSERLFTLPPFTSVGFSSLSPGISLPNRVSRPEFVPTPLPSGTNVEKEYGAPSTSWTDMFKIPTTSCSTFAERVVENTVKEMDPFGIGV